MWTFDWGLGYVIQSLNLVIQLTFDSKSNQFLVYAMVYIGHAPMKSLGEPKVIHDVAIQWEWVVMH